LDSSNSRTRVLGTALQLGEVSCGDR